MNYLHVVKTLDLLEQAPTFFNLEEKTYLAGLTATELKDVKKYIGDGSKYIVKYTY